MSIGTFGLVVVTPIAGTMILFGLRNVLRAKESSSWSQVNGRILKDKRIDGGNALCRETLRVIQEINAEHPGIEQTVIYGTSQRLASARLKRENIVFKQIPYSIRNT